jgi:putative sterol carrier protein
MTKSNEIKQAFTAIQEKFDDIKLREQLKDYSRVIQFTFPDLKTSYVIVIKEGNIVSLTEENRETIDILVTTDSTVLLDILNKKINPMMAYATGKLRVKGKLTDLLKLQKLL